MSISFNYNNVLIITIWYHGFLVWINPFGCTIGEWTLYDKLLVHSFLCTLRKCRIWTSHSRPEHIRTRIISDRLQILSITGRACTATERSSITSLLTRMCPKLIRWLAELAVAKSCPLLSVTILRSKLWLWKVIESSTLSQQ